MCFNPPKPQKSPKAPRLEDAQSAADELRRRRLRQGAAKTLLTGYFGALNAAPVRVRQLLGQ
jgi:hypothetical protein